MKEWIAAIGIVFSPKEWRAAERRVRVRKVMAAADALRCELGIHVNVYLDYPRGNRCSRCGGLVPTER